MWTGIGRAGEEAIDGSATPVFSSEEKGADDDWFSKAGVSPATGEVSAPKGATASFGILVWFPEGVCAFSGLFFFCGSIRDVFSK
jgi:hypothetical protein